MRPNRAIRRIFVVMTLFSIPRAALADRETLISELAPVSEHGSIFVPRIAPELRSTFISYRESGSHDMDESLFGVGANVSETLVPGRLELAGTISLGLLASTQGSRSAKMIEGHAELKSYSRLSRSEWFAEAGVGGMYSTMFISGDVFGFHDLSGPELSIGLARRLDHDSAGEMQVRYAAPILKEGGLKLENSCFGAGAQYRFLVDRIGELAIKAEVQWTSVTFPETSISSRSYAVGISHLF